MQAHWYSAISSARRCADGRSLDRTETRVPRSDRGRPGCTHLDFRIAYYIAHRMDRATGEARIRQSDIAKTVQVTRRAGSDIDGTTSIVGHPGQCGYEGGIVRLISAPSAAEVNDLRAINSIVGQF